MRSIRGFRRYLDNDTAESGDGREYGDSGYEDEDFPDGPEEDEELPEGFHFDDISFVRQAYSDMRALAGQIRAYCREVRHYKLAMEKNFWKEDPLRPFISGIDLDVLAETVCEIMDGIEDQQYTLEERDPLTDQDDLDDLYDQASEMYDTILTLMDSEYASDQSYDTLCSFGDDFDDLYSKFLTDERAEDCTLEEYRELLRDDYLEAYKSDLEYLLTDCGAAEALCRNL